MGNSVQKRRIINVGNPLGRISKQEKQALKDAFDRLQEQQLLSEYHFRMEVLGPQVPDVIGSRLFTLFSSEENIFETMNFEDLVACYVVFKHGRPEEIGQVVFEILKLITGCEMLRKDQFLIFSDRIGTLGYQKKQPSFDYKDLDFYHASKLDPRLPIDKMDFIKVYKKVHSLPIFSWVPDIIKGYSKGCMNMDDNKGNDFGRRLTVISNERAKNETEQMGFNSHEYANMQEFFNNEVKKNDAKEVLKTIQKMMKDIKNAKLKKYFIEYITKHKAFDFKFLSNFVYFICKETDTEKKIQYLFDIFASPFDILKKKQMKDFAEVFDLGINFFGPRGNQISKEDFIDDLKNLHLDFSIYEKTRYVIIAMLALQPATDDEEREAIFTALDNNHKLENYIHEHLEEEDTFYVINKAFWDTWSITMNFNDDKTLTLKKEKVKIINNLELLEPAHDHRLKELTYNEDFILVPKYVFNAFSKWYPCDKAIERKVVQYKFQRHKGLSLFKNKKTQSVMLGNQSSLPDQFFKTVGDLSYELEIYPKYVYYQRINDNGDRPHQKAIINRKIDPSYMKKVLKSDKLPFMELLISRKATFEDVLKIISNSYKEQSKRGRLWIEDQVISGAKLEETLEDFGISIGQVIYVEYSNASNQWPTDKTTQVNLQSTSDFKKEAKTGGLYNLGNTCYMNSALQCLANTKFFYEYFVSQKQYMKQMNQKSKYGFQGDLAQNFAQLMEKLWSTNNGVVYPRPFKNCISAISEQFQGYDQQDSQEFLSFLLDGLHEELNLRQEKPYIENPDSDNRAITELALEQWSNTLRREWSFIFFMFSGQLKSTLNCKSCNKVSTTFDIFTNIPLSLPEPQKILINVTVYRIPNEIKDIIHGHHQQNVMRRLESARSEQHIRGMSQGADRDPENLAKFQETFKYMVNDQPIHICLRVDRDIKIGVLMQQIMEVKDVNIDPHSMVSQLVLYSTSKGSLRGIFNSEFKLTQYNLLTNEIDAIEVLTKKGREVLKTYYQQNPHYLELNPNAHMQVLLEQSEKLENSKFEQRENPQRRPTNKSTKASQRSYKEESFGVKIDKCNLFNNYNVAYDKFQEFDENNNLPEEIYAVAYHRRFVKRSYFFFNPYQPQLLSNPIIFILPLKPTGRRIYQEVWAIAQNILKKQSIYHQKENLWWENPTWQISVQNQDIGQLYKPFVLKTVERTGFACSQCNWMKMCSGCILPPSDDYVEDFFKKCHLAIEWNSSVIEDDYNQSVNEVLQHSSTQDKHLIEEEFINLEDCLRKFQEVEDIGGQDHIYCNGCKAHQEHFKKLEIFRPPPILIIQLKRFKFSNTSRIKLLTMVEFPHYNLDLASFVTDKDFLNKLGIEQKYDLYGIISHSGTLHFGHYVSIVKNQNDGRWYKYDDSFRTPIQEDQIRKEDAYILFYMRKDLQTKNLAQLYPNIQDLFPGKPLRTEKGEGFVIRQHTSQGTYEAKIGKNASSEIIKQQDILEERDTNEIHYDQKDMIEIENKKKEKHNEFIKKQKKRKCRICVSFLAGGTPEPADEDTVGGGPPPPRSTPAKKTKKSLKKEICQIF